MKRLSQSKQFLKDVKRMRRRGKDIKKLQSAVSKLANNETLHPMHRDHPGRKRINIAINTTSAIAGGGVTYLNNLIQYLSELDKRNDYYIYTTRNEVTHSLDKINDKIKTISFWIPSISPTIRMLWEQFILPFYLKRKNIHVLFCPANISVLTTGVPCVVVMQNMAVFNDEFIKHEKIHQKIRLYLLRILTIISMKRANGVVFISKTAQDYICKKYGIKYEKTSVIYHGKDKRFNRKPNEDGQTDLIKRVVLGKYILYVSNIYRYKNFFELILAFIKIKEIAGEEVKLVFAGVSFDDSYYKELKALVVEHKCENQVVFLGNVPNELLPILYAKSYVFAYPSIIENCPNILIEAMGCGAPIISSDIKPMPEICENAALYFDPNDPDDIADKLVKVLKSKELRTELSRKAIERAEFFSWETTAIQTLNVLKSSAC